MRSPGVAPYDEAALTRCAALLIAGARELAELGWTPATSSNFSMRLDAAHLAITCSGADKGRLVEEDILVVDRRGRPVGRNGGRAPSAETALHVQLYARLPDVGCVLHTHSRTQTVASRLYAAAGRVVFEGYELQKAFRGATSHTGAVTVPVVANDQDMVALSARVARALDDGAQWGYLIAGHGLYAWGRDLSEARRHLEAFEFLLGCELETRRLSP